VRERVSEKERERERGREREGERESVCIGLDFAEFQEGMKEVCGHIHLTRDDFDIITENGKVCYFCLIMLFLYHHRKWQGMLFIFLVDTDVKETKEQGLVSSS
jgi:hypothetical protein